MTTIVLELPEHLAQKIAGRDQQTVLEALQIGLEQQAADVSEQTTVRPDATHTPDELADKGNLAQAALNLQQIVARFDALIRELEALRRALTTPSKATPAHSLAEELFGAAGQGTWDEYDLYLDWERFNE